MIAGICEHCKAPISPNGFHLLSQTESCPPPDFEMPKVVKVGKMSKKDAKEVEMVKNLIDGVYKSGKT